MVNWSEDNYDMAGTEAAMIRATRKALMEAKLHNVSIPVWRDNKVVWIPPEEIVIPPESDSNTQPDS